MKQGRDSRGRFLPKNMKKRHNKEKTIKDNEDEKALRTMFDLASLMANFSSTLDIGKEHVREVILNSLKAAAPDYNPPDYLVDSALGAVLDNDLDKFKQAVSKLKDLAEKKDTSRYRNEESKLRHFDVAEQEKEYPNLKDLLKLFGLFDDSDEAVAGEECVKEEDSAEEALKRISDDALIEEWIYRQLKKAGGDIPLDLSKDKEIEIDIKIDGKKLKK